MVALAIAQKPTIVLQKPNHLTYFISLHTKTNINCTRKDSKNNTKVQLLLQRKGFLSKILVFVRGGLVAVFFNSTTNNEVRMASVGCVFKFFRWLYA